MTLPLPADFWAKERENMLSVLMPHIGDAAELGVAMGVAQLAQAGIAFDETGAHTQAAEWARRHTDSLLNVVGTTNEKGIGDVLGQWLETPGADVGDLEQALKGFLDGNISRANSVGVTEITRAVAQGNIAAFAEAGVPVPPMWSDPTGERAFSPPSHVNCRCDTGVVRHEGQLLVVWFTNNDDLVCTRDVDTPWGIVEGCRALQGVCISEGDYLGQKIR